MSELTQKTFGGWPSADEAANLEAEVTRSIRRDGIQVREVKFLSQSPYRLTMFAIGPTSNDEKNKVVRVNVLDQNGWRDFSKAIAIVFPNATDDQPRQSQPSQSQFQAIVDEARSHPNRVTVYVLPRGVGPTEWSRDERERTQIRRRFMQLGQTAASMQIWDVRRALQAIESLPDLASGRREIHASGQAAVWALYASLFEPRIDSLELDGLPAVNRDAPDLLNVSRIVQVPQIVLMASDRINTIRLRVDAKEAADWRPIAESGHIELAVSPL